jgi:acylphosphatase
MEELRMLISGRVQGVMFRDFTQRKARRLGLSGWVRNLPDGRVEVCAQGEHEKLSRLAALLKRGPLFARVEGAEELWGKASPMREGFSIIL